MISNNKISNLVATQLPFFVRNDHANFVAFLEAYYEWLEQSNNTVSIAKSMGDQLDVDKTDIFIESFYKNFLPLIPETTTVDKTLLLKHVKEFYRSRGTEKSVKFLMRVLFGDEDTTFYYPQRDILRASDGKWVIEKSIKIDELLINGITNTSIPAIYNLVGRQITGNTSGATALVEKIDVYYDKGTLVRELKISNQNKEFVDGESIISDFIENGETKSVSANMFSGTINSVQVTEGGTGYQVGQYVNIESNTGTGGVIIVSSVSSGNLTSIAVYEGGAGFKANDSVLVTGGGGSGANAAVSAVTANGYSHPNTYNICTSLISTMSNVRINTSVYTAMNNANANIWLKNAYSYFTYSNTGPISTIILYNAGAGYTGHPTISASANNRVRNMGILGKMIIVDGGRGYRVNDNIYFTNVMGGYGTGAKARVKAVNTASMNAISQVEFVSYYWYPGLSTASANDIIGGTGYDQLFLPTANVVSQNAQANGANIMVTAVLGYGESLVAVGSDAGAIQTLTIVSGGSGYTEAPTLNLRSLGDGTAQATATIITGSYTYPGRYINDDGHLSSYNFLEDRDYYQQFSYVVKLRQSIDKYRQALKSLVHPSGMKVFGEYMVEDNGESMNVSVRSVNSIPSILATKSYTVDNGGKGNLIIAYTNHGLSVGNTVYLDWYTGNVVHRLGPGPYRVKTIVNANQFTINDSVVFANTMNVYPFQSGEAIITECYVKPGGDRLYIVGATNDQIYQYSLSRPYDISTMVYRGKGPFADGNQFGVNEPVVQGIDFYPDGSKYYIIGESNTINEFSLSEKWNVMGTTARTNSLNLNSVSALTSEKFHYALRFSSDGYYLYTTAGTLYTVNQFRLQKPWQINTASYMHNFSVSGVETPAGLTFSSNGKFMYIGGFHKHTVVQYKLNTAWNIATSMFQAYINVALLDPGTAWRPRGLHMDPEGRILYVTAGTQNTIVQLPLTVAYNVNSAISTIYASGTVNVGKIIS